MAALDGLCHGERLRAVEALARAAIGGEPDGATLRLGIATQGRDHLSKGDLVVMRVGGVYRGARFRAVRTAVVGFDTQDDQVAAGREALRLHARVAEAVHLAAAGSAESLRSVMEAEVGVTALPLDCPDVWYVEVATGAPWRVVLGDMWRRKTPNEMERLTRIALRLWA